ncbi:hypothetical protein BGZ60DRAFT_215376 [Tricladium varicosporioides]|nr:hypothetical protein BGZ60DRAFT_215376 [Hymenoscyphus varicosporioides]
MNCDLPSEKISSSPHSSTGNSKSFEPKRCGFVGCPETKLFKQHSSYKKHTDKHTRPYKCTEDDCKVKNFATVGDLKRHQRSLHGNRIYTCPLPSCKRYRHGFGRKDNLTDHMKRNHMTGQDQYQQETIARASEDRNSVNESIDESYLEDDRVSSQSILKEIRSSSSGETASLTIKLRELKERRATLGRETQQCDKQIAAMEIVLTII